MALAANSFVKFSDSNKKMHLSSNDCVKLARNEG